MFSIVVLVVVCVSQHTTPQHTTLHHNTQGIKQDGALGGAGGAGVEGGAAQRGGQVRGGGGVVATCNTNISPVCPQGPWIRL